jgi:hypothetical protein
VDELRPGQQGYVLTTLLGVKPTASPVVVLGVIRNFLPQEDMVLVRLEGEPFQQTGIILGMSGSPVYIEGRLAGAVSHAWAYAKEPIAGVTPIANMLRLLAPSPPSGEPTPGAPGAAGGPTVTQSNTPYDLPGGLRGSGTAPAASAGTPPEAGHPAQAGQLTSVGPSTFEGSAGRREGGERAGFSLVPFFLRRGERTFGSDAGDFLPLGRGNVVRSNDTRLPTPLPLAVSVGGLPAGGLEQLTESFQRAGFVTVTGGDSVSFGKPRGTASPSPAGRESPAAQGVQQPAEGPGAAFEPGAPMAVQLVRGDIDINALGTVTAVVGDRVLGFGHPVLGQAGAELPLANATITAVIPRQQVSLKLWSVLQEVGVTETDGQSGLTGRLGRRATTIPVTLSVLRRDVGREDTYRMEVARHPLLTPDLLGTIAGAVLAVGGSPGVESSAHLVTTITPAGFPVLRYDDWFSGPEIASQVAREVAAVPELLLDNPFGPVEVKGITVAVEVVAERRVATIESLSLNEVTVRPGGTVKVEVTLAPYREPRQQRTLEFKVPADAQPGPRILVVGDAQAEVRLDLLARRHHYEPRSLPELMALLAEEFKQTRLYGRVSQGTFGVAIRGVELPNLPASTLQVLSSPLETDRSAIIGSLTAATETPWVLQGVKAAYLKVSDEKEKEKQP